MVERDVQEIMLAVRSTYLSSQFALPSRADDGVVFQTGSSRTLALNALTACDGDIERAVREMKAADSMLK